MNRPSHPPSVAIVSPARRTILRAMASAALPWPLAALAGAGRLRIGGTGSGMGAIQRVLDEPKAALPPAAVMPNLGSPGGIRALLAGAIDIAVSARPLGDAERSRGLVQAAVFRTPVVWAVGTSLRLESTTLRELSALYVGDTPRWPGGLRVRPILRPPEDADSVLVRSLGPDIARSYVFAHSRPGVRVAATDHDAADDLEHIPGAFGTTTLVLILAERRALRPLVLEGRPPTPEALADGTYGLGRTFHFVTKPSPSPEAAAFLRGMRSPAVQRLLREIGCLAVRDGP